MSGKSNSSVDKTLSILERLSEHKNGLTLAELIKLIDIPKTTAFRILEVLVAREYVTWSPDNERYYNGIKTLEIGMRGLAGMDIVDVAVPCLQDLSATVGETSFLAVYNRGDVVYLYKAEGTRSIQTTSSLGSRRPAYCTALGKAILANLPHEETDRIFEKKLDKLTDKTIVDKLRLNEEFAKTRINGYSVDDEGVEHGLYCMAVPIYNYTGNVVAAISVSGPLKRMNENKDQIVQELKSRGAVISRRLGYVKTLANYRPQTQ